MINYQTPKQTVVNSNESIRFENKGLIFVKQQVAGKPTIIPGRRDIVYLEDSPFMINGERNDNWPVIYCRIAVMLARQGFIVLVPSQQCIVQELNRYIPDNSYEIIYPTRDNSPSLAEGS